MAINGVGVNSVSFARAFPAGAPGGGPRAGRDEMLSSTADLLGMTVDDLKSKLGAGASLDDVASARGVSHDALISNLVDGMSAHAPKDAAGINMTAMAERIAGHHGGGTPAVRSGNGADPSDLLTAVEALAAKLDLSGSDLLAKLESGTTLTDIAAQAGVSMDQLTAGRSGGLMFDVRA
jgi:hypothetical protein